MQARVSGRDAPGRGLYPWAWPVLHTAVEVARPEGAEDRLAETRRMLSANQVTVYYDEVHAGSWDPDTMSGCRDGRIHLTTVCLSALWRTR